MRGVTAAIPHAGTGMYKTLQLRKLRPHHFRPFYVIFENAGPNVYGKRRPRTIFG